MKRLPIVATLALAAYGCGLDSGGDSVVFSGGAAGVGAGTSDAALGGNAGVSSGGTNSGGVSGGGASGAGGSSGSSGAGGASGASGASGTGGVATGGTGGVATGGTGGVATGGTGGVATGGTGGVATGGTGGVATGGTGGVATGGTGGVATGGTGGVATGGTGGVATGGTGGVATGGTGGVATGGTGGVATGGTGGTGGVTGLDCTKWPGAKSFAVQGKTHCYWLNNSGKNFDDSKKTCSDAGGYLATIHSKAENDFVKSVAFGNASAVWIGLWRPFLAWCSTGSNFEWVTNEANPYQNWDSGEPNCSGQGGVMDSGGGWRDRAGWESYAFVCEAGPAYQ